MSPTNMRPVKSSNVAEIGHDPITQTMYVRFRDGGLYAYPGTGPAEVSALLAAPSIGKALRQRHGHKAQRV